MAKKIAHLIGSMVGTLNYVDHFSEDVCSSIYPIQANQDGIKYDCIVQNDDVEFVILDAHGGVSNSNVHEMELFEKSKSQISLDIILDILKDKFKNTKLVYVDSCFGGKLADNILEYIKDLVAKNILPKEITFVIKGASERAIWQKYDTISEKNSVVRVIKEYSKGNDKLLSQEVIQDGEVYSYIRIVNNNVYAFRIDQTSLNLNSPDKVFNDMLAIEITQDLKKVLEQSLERILKQVVLERVPKEFIEVIPKEALEGIFKQISEEVLNKYSGQGFIQYLKQVLEEAFLTGVPENIIKQVSEPVLRKVFLEQIPEQVHKQILEQQVPNSFTESKGKVEEYLKGQLDLIKNNEDLLNNYTYNIAITLLKEQNKLKEGTKKYFVDLLPEISNTQLVVLMGSLLETFKNGKDIDCPRTELINEIITKSEQFKSYDKDLINAIVKKSASEGLYRKYFKEILNLPQVESFSKDEILQLVVDCGRNNISEDLFREILNLSQLSDVSTEEAEALREVFINIEEEGDRNLLKAVFELTYNVNDFDLEVLNSMVVEYNLTGNLATEVD